MLHGILKSLTDKKFAPLEGYFFQRVNKLKRWLNLLNIFVGQFPLGELSPIRSFFIASQRLSDDPQSYYYKQGKFLDPLGWRRCRKSIYDCLKKGRYLKQYIESHTSSQKDEHYYNTLHRLTWDYQHTLKIIQNYAPNRYMVARIHALEAAYEAFNVEYHKRWNELKERLIYDYHELNAKIHKQPNNVALLYFKKRFETIFEDGLDETENCIQPDKLAKLTDKAGELETVLNKTNTLSLNRSM